MNILQICNKSPWPPREGGPIAMYNLAEGLMQHNHRVEILTMSTPKYPVDPDTLPVDYRYRTGFTSVFVDTDIKLSAAIVNLFSSRSYHAERFVSEDFAGVLRDMIGRRNYDIIHLETIYAAPYLSLIRSLTTAPVVLRAHNVEHLIWQRFADQAHNPARRVYIRYLTRKLKKFETEVFSQVDAIATITAIDADIIRGLTQKPVIVVPFGLDTAKYASGQPTGTDEISFFHIGSMDWMPNAEAIRWFLENVMPEAARRFPANRFVLAGRNMPSWVTKYDFPNLEIAGEVDDAAEFMLRHPVMFVPLLSGSGIRIKIVEAMALGRTVISTPLGAEGIAYTNEHDILLAQSPAEFISRIDYCIQHPAECRTIGRNARELMIREHQTGPAVKPLISLYSELLTRAGGK